MKTVRAARNLKRVAPWHLGNKSQAFKQANTVAFYSSYCEPSKTSINCVWNLLLCNENQHSTMKREELFATMLVIAFFRLSPAHFFRRWSARGQWCHWMNVPTCAKCEDVTMQKQPRWKLHTGKTWRNVLHGHILSGRGGYKGGTGSMCHVSCWVDDGLAETWSKIAIMWILAWLRHAGCTQKQQPHQTWPGVAAGLK